MVFHSFDLTAVNPKYTALINSEHSLFEVDLAYFVAGTGRCSSGQCPNEIFKFFLEIFNEKGESFELIQINKKLSDIGGGFGGSVSFSKVIPTSATLISFRFFMFDTLDNIMSNVFPPQFITRSDSPTQPPPPSEPIRPTAPIMNTVTNISVNTFNLNWQAPNDSGSSPLQDYILSIFDNTRNQAFRAAIGTGNNNTFFDEIAASPDTSYTAVVSARNTEGLVSEPSSEVTFQTLSIPIPDPDPIPDPIPDPDPIPQTDWITQSLGIFNLKDDRITGETLFLRTSKFDPFFYGVNLTGIFQVKDVNGAVIVIKNNNLVFTEAETDERILYDEAAFGNKEVTIESFVWNDLSQAFSLVKTFTLKEEEPPQIPPPSVQNLDWFKALPIVGIGALFLNAGLRNKRVGKKN